MIHLLQCSLLIWLTTLSYTLNYAQEGEGEVTYVLLEDIAYRDTNTASITPYVAERCRLDIYYPKDIDTFATVVWFHGGGLRAGEKYIPAELKNQGMAVVAANYRLHPKVKAPVYIEDAAASVSWVFKNITKYGGDTNLIFVSGHSAGGYLTSMIGLDKKYLGVHDIDADRIAGLIPYSGHAITHFTIRTERGLTWDKPIIDEYAPLYHCRKDAPPMILVTGDREMELFGRYEEVAYQMRMMKLVGHEHTELYELDGYNHGEMDEPAHHILLNSVRKIQRSIYPPTVE